MTTTNTITGSNVLAMTKTNPRIELRAVIEANLKLDRVGHFKIFQDQLFAGIDRSDLEPDATDLLDAVIASWFSQHYPSVVQDAENQALNRLKTGTRAEQAQAKRILKEREEKRRERVEKKAESAKKVKTAVANTVAEVTRKVEAFTGRLLLDTVTLPNGKLLRDATGAECARAGGFLSALALDMSSKGASNQTVGENYTEKQLQKILMAK